MLEKIDLSKKMSKEEFDKVIDGLEAKAGLLQRECRELKIPVIILFEGFGASGKGTLINSLIHALDPRGFRVYAINGESEDEIMRPYLWRFWTKTPEKGTHRYF